MGGNMFYKMRKITAISIITIFLLNMFFSSTININVYAAEKVGTSRTKNNGTMGRDVKIRKP